VPVSMRTFRGPVVLNVLLGLRAGLNSESFWANWAAVKAVKAPNASMETRFIAVEIKQTKENESQDI
jgi:hypothetical protein